MHVDLSRYSKPALAFSGGKDSLALLYMLRDQLDRVAVYWCNTGDGCPETLAVIDQVRKWVPHFAEVRTDVASWRDAHGWPSDLIPDSGHELGVAYGMGSQRISSKFECCMANLMLPLHQRLVDDKVDCVIRGTKVADTGRVPHEGPSAWYTVLLPLRNWTHEQVFAYLREVGAPENPIYDHFGAISAPECFGCTAWWDDRKADYFRARHPEQLAPYQAKLRAIRVMVAEHLTQLDKELEA